MAKSVPAVLLILWRCCYAWNPLFLAKTKETFKLADLQLLEAQLQADEYTCRRLAVDAATGSSLLELIVGESSPNFEERVRGRDLSSSLRRCEWIGSVIAKEATAEQLVAVLKQTKQTMKPWTLNYQMLKSSMEGQLIDRRYSQRTLLCAVSQSLEAPAALDPATVNDKLLLLETESAMFLIKMISTTLEQSLSISSNWSHRPFPYSSAINPEIAEIVVDILVHLVDKTNHTAQLLDPACGSGTFLAFAMDHGLEVVGWDCNERCIQGCRANLEHIFGEERVQKACQLQLRDSTVAIDPAFSPVVDCVACNLPWGLNTVNYDAQNDNILMAVRTLLPTGVPCAFVAKEELKDIHRHGYRVLGHAHVPQQNFTLPKGTRKRRRGDDSDSIPNRKGRSDCTITIVKTVDFYTIALYIILVFMFSTYSYKQLGRDKGNDGYA